MRVVPCDFSTPGAKGVRGLHDTVRLLIIGSRVTTLHRSPCCNHLQKLAIREFVQELGVQYTFIDVGAWMQGWLPLPKRSTLSEEAKQMAYTTLGNGQARTLVTDLHHIGRYVARIIADPRTLNHAVIVWEDETTQAEALDLGVRLSGDGEALRAKYVRVSISPLVLS